MTSSLSNFSIESDSVVLLQFFDGTHKRVPREQIERHVSGKDLERVRRALRLRRQFISRVLPPGAMALLLAATVALAVHDAHQLAAYLQLINPPAPSQNIAAPTSQAIADPIGVVIEGMGVAPAPNQRPDASGINPNILTEAAPPVTLGQAAPGPPFAAPRAMNGRTTVPTGPPVVPVVSHKAKSSHVAPPGRN